MYSKILKKINEFQTIIIHRHGRPDGDAIGSQIGLRETLKFNFPDKRIYVVGDESTRFEFLGTMDNIPDSFYSGALAIVLDCSDELMINDSRWAKASYVIKIDHHIIRSNYGDMNIVEVEECSCASLLAKMIFSWKLKTTNLGAKALFTGIVTDSGRFRYDTVTSSTFELVSKLLKYNFNMNDIYNILYIEELDIVKLRAKYILDFKLTHNNVAYIKNTYQNVLDMNIDFFTASRGMVNCMAGIKGIDIWVNFTEDENGKVIVEIRSNKYNINPVATKYGGGGHKMASGCTVDNFEIADKILKELDNMVGENNE